MSNPKLNEHETEDLKDLLIDFWVEVVRGHQGQVSDKLKAAESLAKYILHDGRTSVKARRAQSRPATADVLRLIQEIEGKENA